MDKIVLLIVFCYRYFCDCKKNVTRMTLIWYYVGQLFVSFSHISEF